MSPPSKRASRLSTRSPDDCFLGPWHFWHASTRIGPDRRLEERDVVGGRLGRRGGRRSWDERRGGDQGEHANQPDGNRRATAAPSRRSPSRVKIASSISHDHLIRCSAECRRAAGRFRINSDIWIDGWGGSAARGDGGSARRGRRTTQGRRWSRRRCSHGGANALGYKVHYTARVSSRRSRTPGRCRKIIPRSSGWRRFKPEASEYVAGRRRPGRP